MDIVYDRILNNKYGGADMELENTIKNKFIKLGPPQILVLGFLIIICIGAFLLNLPFASQNGQSIGVLNAFFTATSAVCVTGLIVVDTATHWTVFGQTVIIILIQIGGLGFMTMTTLFFLAAGKRITMKERILMQSALNKNTLSGIVSYTKYILIFTFFIEGIGALLLSLRFIPRFGVSKGIGMSVFHAISAFCNAGFDLIGNFRSLTPFQSDWLINVTIMILIIIGGLGFSVIIDLINHKKLRRISMYSKIVLFMSSGLILLGALVIYLLESNNPTTLGGLSFQDKMLASLFQGVTPRTAGFNTIDLTQLTMGSKFFITILMFIGGSPGSTAGGVKTVTIGVLIIAVISVLQGKKDTEIFKRRIAINIIREALAVVMIVIFLSIAMIMILTITEKATFMEIFFEVISALGTVGLTLGTTPELSTAGKIIIAFGMFIGRLGPLTIGFAISRRQGQYYQRNYRYPKGDIMVG